MYDNISTPTLGTGDQNSNSYVRNGKIMVCSVIILFVVVLILVCFHSYARWLFHRYHRRRRVHQLFFLSAATTTTTNTNNNAGTVPPQALDLPVLKTIPTFVYSSSSRTKEQMLECAVCLSEFGDKERGRVLPKCKHTFHVDCIDTWFRSHSNCPLCRTPVHPPAEVMSVTEPASLFTEREGCEMGCSSNSSLPSLELELVRILVEMPRGRGEFRGLDDMGLGSSEGTGFKTPGNQVQSLERIWSI